MLCSFWPGASPSDELERALEDFVRRASVWPGLAIDPASFLAWTAERLGAADARVIAESPAADLALAQACAGANPIALRHFESVLAAVRPAIASLGASREDIDEVVQRLRVQLLVGAPPGIAAYGGRGELRAWVRVTAVREAVRLLRDRGRAESVGDQRLLEAFLPEVEWERDLIGEEWRAAFRAAFEEAVAELPPLERLLLRQHAVDDLTIDQIGVLHGVHRATVARWLDQARATLSAATERALQRRLKTSLAEVRNTLRLYLSRLDVSVQRLLGA